MCSVSAAAASNGSRDRKSKKARKGKAQSETDSESETEAETAPINVFGVGGINRPVGKKFKRFFTYCPLHLAAEKGFIVCSPYLCLLLCKLKYRVAIVEVIMLINMCLVAVQPFFKWFFVSHKLLVNF